MKKITLLITLLVPISISATWAQIRIPVYPIEKITRNITAASVKDQTLLTSARVEPNSFVIRKWDGIAWKRLAILSFENPDDSIYTLMEDSYQRLIIAGKFSLIHKGDTFKNIIVGKPFQWTSPFHPDDFKETHFIHSVIEWNKHLVIGGHFNQFKGQLLRNLLFLQLPELHLSSDIPSGMQGNLLGVASQKHRLWVYGGLLIDGNNTSVAEWKEPRWEPLECPLISVSHMAVNSRNMLMASGLKQQQERSFYTLSQGVWAEQTAGVRQFNHITDLISVDTLFYAVGNFTHAQNPIYWIRFDGKKWDFIPHRGLAKRVFSDGQTAFVHFTGSLNISPPQQPQFGIGTFKPGLNMIFGDVHLDLNGNCEKDANDIPISQINLLFNQIDRHITTGDSGQFVYWFEDSVPTDIRVSPSQLKFKHKWCLADSIQDTNGNGIIGPIRLLVQPLEITPSQLQSSLVLKSGMNIQQGSRNDLVFTLKNHGLQKADNVLVKFSGSNQLKNFQSNYPIRVLNDSLIRWDLGDIAPLQSKTIAFSFAIQDNRDIPDNELFFDMVFEYQSQHETKTGKNTFLQSVTDFDEDARKIQFIKQKPLLDFDYIHTTDTIITYQILFRNMLDEVLEEVTIIDTLDLSLPFSYIQELASGHEYSTQLIQDSKNPNRGYLLWHFSGLNLQPNPTNNPEIRNDRSFIQFQFVFKYLPHQQHIFNRAGILMNGYFNTSTNSVVVVTDQTLSKSKPFHLTAEPGYTCYPNPAKDLISISGPNTGGPLPYSISDPLGKTWLEGTTNGVEIDVSSLTSGLYFLTLPSRDGRLSIHKIIIAR
jgi:hypothetical protein